MDGVWYKLCPRCRNYIKKEDPQDSGICCACGWEEYPVTYFCEVFNRNCMLFSTDHGEKMAA